ncbi:MAG TPA: diaminopimelate epimerase [Acidimicrobiia bacterium]|nr:diaminopimelate epimerase [Acidimicrobiia bacterium]
MSTLRLSKLHATGNDFLVHEGDLPAEAAPLLCDRHRGVGADGLLLLLPGAGDADCAMVLYNADGSRAEMSGNGVRCLAWAAVRAGLGDGKRLVVGTDAGRRVVDVECDAAGDVVAAAVDMGPVTIGRDDTADVGNPHLVLFVDDVAAAPVTSDGPGLEHDPRFPDRTNVEFVAVTGANELTMRVWERGVGETLSCGTGACAAAAVAHAKGLVGDHVTVRVPGGDLAVELGDTARLGGPVVHVFDVDVELP